MPITLVATVTAFCYSGILSFLSFFAIENHITSAASFFFVVYAAAVLVTRPFSGRMFDLKGPNFIMYPSIISLFIGLFVLSQSHVSIRSIDCWCTSRFWIWNLYVKCSDCCRPICTRSSCWISNIDIFHSYRYRIRNWAIYPRIFCSFDRIRWIIYRSWYNRRPLFTITLFLVWKKGCFVKINCFVRRSKFFYKIIKTIFFVKWR